MTAELTKTIKLFYCYAHEDKLFRDELDLHLSSLKRQQHITTWYDREIRPGAAWEKEIETHLKTAHIILLLVSPHFIASDYCYGIEMEQALARHEVGTARVIPIIIRPVDWEDAPFRKLQMLPTDALPVTRWPDRDHAFADIARHIRTAIKDMQIALKAKELLEEGNSLYVLKRYEEAITAYDQAIHLDPNYALAYHDKGVSLEGLKRYEESLIAYDQTIRLNPDYILAYAGKGNALHELKRYEGAITALDQAIHLDPNYALAYHNKGTSLHELKRYEEALTAYDQAIRLNPNEALAYYNKGNALGELKRYEEAITAYDQTIRLNPNYALAYYNKGLALQQLGKDREAQQAYKKAYQLGYTS